VISIIKDKILLKEGLNKFLKTPFYKIALFYIILFKTLAYLYLVISGFLKDKLDFKKDQIKFENI
jgi:hypothetical protein